MTSYTKLTIIARREQEDELTMLSFEQGALGVAVEDPAIIQAHLLAGSWDASIFDGQDIVIGELTLIATFERDEAFPARQDALSAQLEQLAGVSYSWEDLPNIDWQQQWKQAFRQLPIGQNLLVRPYWLDNQDYQQRTEIIIDPGLAFGTGDHETTAMMLALIEQYLQPGTRVLDIGCGSGILAIAALKLGAAAVDAIDIDAICAKETARHCGLNNIDEMQFNFYLGDIVADAKLKQQLAGKQYQLIVANINTPIVLKLIHQIAPLLAKNGLFICSGILENYQEQLEEALGLAGFSVSSKQQEKDWLAYAAKQPSNILPT